MRRDPSWVMAETKRTILERIDRSTLNTLSLLRDIKLEITSIIELGLNIQSLAQQAKDGITMANQAITDLTQQFNLATNDIAARIDRLITQIGEQVTAEQLTELTSLKDRLTALGRDPANPIPPAPVV